jgi:hypothetical protein
MTSAPQNGQEQGREGPLNTTAKWVLRIAATLVLLWIAGIAIWLGSQDVLWPVSFTAQILGDFFIVAGLTTLAGAVLVAARGLFPASSHRISYVAAAAVAGSYITLTITVHSFRYEPLKAWLYGVLAVLCLLLASQTLPRAWPDLKTPVKNIGITLGVLGGVASFWYQSFYLPEDTQVGIQYGLSVVSVTPSDNDSIFILDLTMEDQSSVVSLTLGSMVAVSGLTFPKSASESTPAAQQNIDKYAQELATPPPVGATPPNPNIGSSGSPSAVILAVMRPVNNDSFMFPGDTLSRDFDVVVPKSNITALEIELNILYARTTRLTLGTTFRPTIISPSWCKEDEQSSWNINQSALVRYTRGAQIFYSNWCASATSPYIGWDVQAAGGKRDTAREVYEIGNDIGIEHSSRAEIFALPPEPESRGIRGSAPG